MRQIKYSVAAVLAIVATLGANEDLGLITVESSTIDSKLDTKKTEVSSVAIISGEEVEKINPISISDLLNTIPGITLAETGTDSVKVHIRGVDNQMYYGEQPGVAIIIDGVSVQETSGKINIDMDNIESIKVIKGGASYLYGNDALAGAIVITTKRAKGVSSSKVEAEGGSFGTKRFLASTNQSFENSALQVQGSYRDSDGYWDEAFVKIKSVSGKYIYYINDTSDITFGLDYTKRETGDGNSVSGTIEAKTNPTSAGYYSYSGYQDSDLMKGFVTYSNDLDENSNLMLRVHKYQDDKTFKTGRFTKDNIEVWDQNGAKGEYRTSFDKLAVMVGVDVQRNKTDESIYDIIDGEAPIGGSDGDLLNDYKTQEDVNALYAEVKHQTTEDLTTTFNLRYDNIKHDYKDNIDSAENVSPSYHAFSYRAGLNYNLSKDSSIYSSVSTGFRVPTVRQTSANQVALKADPSLNIPSEIGIETTYNYEIGIRGNLRTLTYDASVFQLDRKDYIGRIAGNYITSDDDDESNYDNIGDMRSRGFELALNSDRSKMLSFNLAYTYLDAKFTNYTISQQMTEDPDGRGPLKAEYQRVDLSGNTVPRTSKHTLNLIIDYEPTSKLTISPEIIIKSTYYADEINTNKQAGYEVVNLRGKYKFNDSLEIFSTIANLFDKNYYQFVNINSSALAAMEDDAVIRVAPPRAYYVGLRYKF